MPSANPLPQGLHNSMFRNRKPPTSGLSYEWTGAPHASECVFYRWARDDKGRVKRREVARDRCIWRARQRALGA